MTFLDQSEWNTSVRSDGKKAGMTITILLFLAVMAVAFYAYMKNQNIGLDSINLQQLLSGGLNGKQVNTVREIYEIAYDSKEKPVFGVYRDYIVKCSRDGIRMLDKKGTEVWTTGVSLNKPIVKTNGTELLVVDIGGTDIFVIDGQNVRWREKTDAVILNADINERGYVTVTTESKRYNGEVRVFDENGIELFRSIIASDFAVTARVARSLRQMAIDSISADGVKSFTGIKFFDLKGNELAGKSLEAYDDIFPAIYYTSDDVLFAVGDTSILCFDRDRNVKWEKKFLQVSSACITGGKHFATVVGETAGRELKIFDANGQQSASCPVDGIITNISAYGGLIAVNAVREVDFYTEKCRNIGKYTSKSDILDVYFFNKQQAAVVTRSYVAVVKID